VPSELPYKYGEGMRKAAEQAKTAPQPTNTPVPADMDMSEDAVRRRSVVSLLYPGSETTEENSANFIEQMGRRLNTQSEAETGANATPPDAGPTPRVIPPATDGLSSQIPSIPDNQTIAAANPFSLSVLSARFNGDALISGRLRLTNRTGLTVENAYFELTLDYPALREAGPRYQYAYVRGLNLAPGETKELSYATIPPVKGDTNFSMSGIALAAFDTHIDGEARKVYIDTDQDYLEVLSFDI
jgi:hypothetical protein